MRRALAICAICGVSGPTTARETEGRISAVIRCTAIGAEGHRAAILGQAGGCVVRGASRRRAVTQRGRYAAIGGGPAPSAITLTAAQSQLPSRRVAGLRRKTCQAEISRRIPFSPVGEGRGRVGRMLLVGAEAHAAHRLACRCTPMGCEVRTRHRPKAAMGAAVRDITLAHCFSAVQAGRSCRAFCV